MQKTVKKSSEWAYFLLVLLIPVIVYLLSFSSVIYSKPFIENHMRESGLRGYSIKMNSFVVDYLMDKDESELIKIEIFDEKEKQHLLDVKILVHRVFDFLFLALALFFYLIYINYKSNKWGNMNKILVYGGMITVAVPIILYFIPFEPLFTAVHNIFFTDGSWVFSQGSALIQMYPFDFWYRAGFGLFVHGFVTGWLLIILGFIVGKK